jgi:hypothetical protein
VIPLAMVVRGELLQRSPKMPFTERNDSVQAFLLDRPDEPLRVGVAIRRTGRRANHTHTTRAQPLLYAAAPLRVMITKQQSAAGEESRLASGVAQALDDERLIWTTACTRSPESAATAPRAGTLRSTSSRPRRPDVVVKKSAATSAGQCAWRNVRHFIGRCRPGRQSCPEGPVCRAAPAFRRRRPATLSCTRPPRSLNDRARSTRRRHSARV